MTKIYVFYTADVQSTSQQTFQSPQSPSREPSKEAYKDSSFRDTKSITILMQFGPNVEKVNKFEEKNNIMK